MQEVIVIAEGQTEEVFIKRVVAPIFHSQQIFLKPVLMKTSATAKGGAVTFDRLKLNIRNEIRRNQNIKLTTFLDLYGLDTSFPDFNQAQSIQDVYLRVEHLEQAYIESLLHLLSVDLKELLLIYNLMNLKVYYFQMLINFVQLNLLGKDLTQHCKE